MLVDVTPERGHSSAPLLESSPPLASTASLSAAIPSLASTRTSATASFDPGPTNPLSRIITPLLPDVWERELAAAGILDKFSFIPDGLRYGFDVGLEYEPTMSLFPPSRPYVLYDNHLPALRYPKVIEKMIDEETKEGRISAFYDPDELYKLVGPFRNAPLTVAPKNGSYDDGRVCQDFSHPRDDPLETSFNASLDMSAFECDWGTFAQCYLLAARAPPRTEVAVFDVKAAHRRVPIRAWQQAFCVLMWNGRAALNHCCQFGAASSSGLWGKLADAFRALFIFTFTTSSSINWADDFTFWRYLRDNGHHDITEQDIYDFAEKLGWPWSVKKTVPFSTRFKYLGFEWDLVAKTVEITSEKKTKYLDAISGWKKGSTVTQHDAQSVLGKLVHCTLVVPEGRSRLPALSRFAYIFDASRPHARMRLPDAVAMDLDWWKQHLALDFLGMPVREIPPARNIDFFVDASTGWGIGLTIGDQYDLWKLKPGWKSDGRDIGWAEMVAVELGLRVLIERRFEDTHVCIRSDNQGVVGALDAGKSRSVQSNRVLQRIVTLMLEHRIWLSCEWVASEDNPADAPSRGKKPKGMKRKAHAFKIPFPLKDFVESV